VISPQSRVLKESELKCSSLNPASAEKLTPLFSLSLKVIMEMVRLANIVPGIFRKALQDVEIKGTHQEYHPAHAAASLVLG